MRLPRRERGRGRESEVFLKWVDGETPPSLKENEKYGFLGAVAILLSLLLVGGCFFAVKSFKEDLILLLLHLLRWRRRGFLHHSRSWRQVLQRSLKVALYTQPLSPSSKYSFRSVLWGKLPTPLSLVLQPTFIEFCNTSA